MPKAFLIDTTRCTACRGCQVSCKEWKGLPSLPTKQRGSHQNPPDLSHANLKLVRFSEHLEGDTVRWYFFPDQCRHCLEPPCKEMADGHVPGAIVKDAPTGAVLFTDKSKKLSIKQFQEVQGACPFNIPRRNPDTKMAVKCDMCIDRVRANRLPMCVKTCAMGAMNFGERDQVLKLAAQRLETVKKEFPKSALLNQDDVSVIFLLADAPEKYHKFAASDSPGARLTRQQMLDRLVAAPLRRIGRQISV
jgi:formate dehydrogenase iron-sulfur subunit